MNDCKVEKTYQKLEKGLNEQCGDRQKIMSNPSREYVLRADSGTLQSKIVVELPDSAAAVVRSPSHSREGTDVIAKIDSAVAPAGEAAKEVVEISDDEHDESNDDIDIEWDEDENDHAEENISAAERALDPVERTRTPTAVVLPDRLLEAQDEDLQLALAVEASLLSSVNTSRDVTEATRHTNRISNRHCGCAGREENVLVVVSDDDDEESTSVCESTQEIVVASSSSNADIVRIEVDRDITSSNSENTPADKFANASSSPCPAQPTAEKSAADFVVNADEDRECNASSSRMRYCRYRQR